MTKLIVVFLLTFSVTTFGATIAVIDSGTDVEHIDFQGKLWINQDEIADNGRDDDDGNGYQDDLYGWNFAESNNLVIDRSYLGTFSNDPYKFFELQGKAFMGTITEEEKAWINAKRQDPEFIKEMGKFGNFVHGTHVAGITQNNNPSAKILSVKLIPTEVKLPGQKNIKALKGEGRKKILEKALSALANTQMQMLEEVFWYVGSQKADIANGSFGTGFDQIKPITDAIYKVIYFKAPSKEQSDETARFFMNKMLEFGSKAVAKSPNTLFVFAAGNSAMNNDLFPTSPTNIIANNVISVAATYKYDFIAPFSNYGDKMVDVAAPGMLIHSQIPGNEYLQVSGTSQASPFVANVAAQIKDANNNLTPAQIKKILMGTVDTKSFLDKKVKSKGIVNADRAVLAAHMSLSMELDAAIESSRLSVQDVPTSKSVINFNPEFITPIPLPSLFK